MIELTPEAVQALIDAFVAQGVFHTPVANQKLNGNRNWNEYQTDAIERKQKAVEMLRGSLRVPLVIKNLCEEVHPALEQQNGQ